MSDQNPETDLDEKIHSSVADKVMSFVEEGDDQEIRATRDKIEAFNEQINELEANARELELKINQAADALEDKKGRIRMLIGRREIEHVKLFHLEKLARSHAVE